MPLPVASARLLEKSIHWRGLAIGLIAVPVICYCTLLLLYVVNVPWIDDIDAFLSFIIGYLDETTLSAKFDWLIRPNNEHRILTGKLITVLMYKLTGMVNYRWLVDVAFLFLLGMLALFYRVFQSTKLPLMAFVPISFLLLQPQYYLTSMWAITAMQHQVVLLLVFGAVYLLASATRARFGGALGVQVLASLSMSNGLFGWVAGAAVLVVQRQWLRLLVWVLVGAGTIVFYFHDFPNGQGNESSVSYFLEHPHLVFFGFFTFAGGLFDFFSKAPILWRSVLPTLAGFGLMALVFRLLWTMNKTFFDRQASRNVPLSPAMKARQKRRYFFTGCYTFLLVNALTIAFLRPRFGYEVMLISNYMIYAAVLVVLLYLNVLSEQASSPGIINGAFVRWMYAGLLLGVVVWTNWYVVNLTKIAYRKHQILTSAFNQKHNKTGLGPSWGSSFLKLADNTLTETTRRGIYRYPDAYYTPYESTLLSLAPMPVDTALNMRVLGGGYNYIAETDFNALPEPIGPAAVVIRSNERTYLFPSEWPYTFSNFYLNRPVKAVRGEIINPTVAPGQYRVGIFTPSNKLNPIRFSNKVLTVPE